ncbi:MAG: diaminopimelate epimerase [Synechococcus sp. MED-G71]|nr:MAG: diaminopimelate epimerase [Synechococcus sp. MED-G71]
MDGRRGDLPDYSGEPARALCDRRFGIGADGLILALPARDGGDVRMQILNADGSEAEMCGNGIRCFARFLADLDGSGVGMSWRVETPAGVIIPKLLEGCQITVDMGEPILEPAGVPSTIAPGHPLADAELEVDGLRLQVAAVGMGNPHAVVQVSDTASVDLERLGPALEQHPAFPARTNVHFVAVESPDRLRVRVWERGAGPTLACGTGACATLVATHLRGACERNATVELPGGPLQISWDQSNHLQMAGPAVLVFSGTLADPTSADASGGSAVNASEDPSQEAEIDCATACSEGCQRPQACPSAAAREQALAFLDQVSLDQMVNLANNSVEERTRRRIGF